MAESVLFHQESTKPALPIRRSLVRGRVAGRAETSCLSAPNLYLGPMTDLVKTAPAAIPLATRAGWPADLRLLVERYPREVWSGHANLGAMAQFWLQRHTMFREIGAALEEATTAFREGTATAADFRAFF